MIFTGTPIPGAWIIDIEPMSDERGLFARTLCVDEFEFRGLNGRMVQQSVSWNPRVGTLRGLHFQTAPFEEEKLVRVTRGAIFDVIVDLRSVSPAYGRWFGIELSADNRRQIYIPKGVAHGFQTIDDGTEVLYEMTVPYRPEAASGFRWNDPELCIVWPEIENRLISTKDQGLPLFSDLR